MSRLMISISGIRGVYGDGLDDSLAEKFACAFGTLFKGKIVVGRDSRISGGALSAAVIRGLAKTSAHVIDLGLCSTPTTEMAVTAKGAAGGIIITASHNPGEWNGLKFLGPDGVFLNAAKGAELLAQADKIKNIETMPENGTVEKWDGADDHHIESVLALDIIDRDLIISRKFKICVDSVNGAGGPICNKILGKLGCESVYLNCTPNGIFPHNPEPVPANLINLCSFIKIHGADVGFAVDPDVDRLSLVDGSGVAIGEEFTLAIVADYIMEKTGTDGACNLSTSRMIDDAAKRRGVTVHRSAVGEINVVELMRKAGAGIGGEGNGGIIYPALHTGRDAVLGIALILQIMAEKNKTISELAGMFPRYSMIKDKIALAGKTEWRAPVKELFPGAETDERDGLKILFTDSWIHVRESNTEPIVRIISEAVSEEKAKELIQKVRDKIG